jgi:hypothetical protein
MKELPEPESPVNESCEGDPQQSRPASARIPVWSWTEAVAKASVPALTKLVCLNIARYLSDAGKGWFITTKEMMADTGMSERSLVTHLENAEKAQLIVREVRHNRRGYRAGTFYKPCFPDGTELAREPAEMGGSLDAPPACRQGRRPSAGRASGKGDHLDARGALRKPRLSAGGAPQENLSIGDPSHQGPPVVPQRAAGGRRPPASYLPRDWQPLDGDREWALEHAPQMADRIEAEVQAFRDANRKRRDPDWSAAWRNHWRRAVTETAREARAKGAEARAAACRSGGHSGVAAAKAARPAPPPPTWMIVPGRSTRRCRLGWAPRSTARGSRASW